MDKIFGVKRNNDPIKNGIIAQFPQEDFPKTGSHIEFVLTGNRKTSEEVTVRDEYTKTYQTVRKTPQRDTISTMKFNKVTPTKTEIEWTLEVKPKGCGNFCMANYMEDQC